MTNRYRRTFLGAALAWAGLGLFGPRVRAAARVGPRPLIDEPPLDVEFALPLRIPGNSGLLADVRLSGPLPLTANFAKLPIFVDGATTVWCYKGTIAGKEILNPLLRVRRGETIDVTLTNRLGDDTTIHWHGLSVDEINDGSGLHPVRHQTDFRYHFPVRDRAALYWYHAHPHNRTGEQVHQGLAGLLLVQDDDDDALRAALGLEWGVTEIPLFIADKQIGLGNKLDYAVGEDDWIGNRVLVNWVPEPYHDVTPRLYRFRVANVAGARVFRLAFLHEGNALPYTLIGTDSGLLEKPVVVKDVFLAPAQRIDVLLDLAKLKPGAKIAVKSIAYEPMDNEGIVEPFDPMQEHPGAAMMGEALDIMELRVVDGPRAKKRRIPKRLSKLPTITTDDASTRKLKLWISDDGRWFINDWNFHLFGHDPAFTIKRGSREIWAITNAMKSMPHPVHLHGFQFRVLSRDGSPQQVRRQRVARNGLTPHDLGLLDTVLVWPGETVRIALDFSQPYSGKQTYMFHCHNLEHEDQGMMISFAVDD